MELNILLRGQSNAIFFDRFGGYAAVQADVERLLGFDGVNQKVNLLGGEAPDAAGWATTFGGTALLPPSQYHWLDLVNGDYNQGFTPAVYEQSLLNYIADLPADEHAAPTAVLFMQDESDASVSGGETTAEWTDAVRYEAGLVRNALGQTAATVPYLFVPIPFDSADAATMQAIRLGQDDLSADATFNGLTATRTGDVDMNNPYNGLPAGTVIFGGPHLNEADVALLAARIAPSVADAFAQYALPGSPVALAKGHLDDSGPQAVRVDWTPTRPTQVIVTLQDDPSASGLMPLGAAAASGLGWTIRDGATSIAANAAAVLPGNQLMLTFNGYTPTDSAARLYYDYGTGRLAVGADTHTGTGYPGTGPGSPGEGNGIYDNNGLPAWSAAAGVPVTTATVALVVSAGVVAPAVTLYEGDTQTILDGGTGQDTTALTGSLLTISSGGSATGAVLDGGEGVVAFGGSVTGITLNGGVISVAGAATGTTVSSGAETVLSGGIETGGTVLSGGGVVVSGGTVNTEVVGGSLTVGAGGFLVASTILGGGNIRVHDGGTLTGHFRNDGDVVFDISGNNMVNAGFSGAGSLTVSGGGTLTLAGVSSLSGILNIDGGTLELLTAGAGGYAPITFNGTGSLVLDAVSPGGVISGFGPGYGHTIEVKGLGVTPTIGRAGDIVTLSDGNSSVVLDVAGSEQYGFEALPGSGDAFTSPNAVFLTEQVTPCYCPGTLITTTRGDVPVEDIRIGDEVVTVSGVLMPIRWIGRRAYAGRFIRGRRDLLPVCIAAGALADSVPRRDLHISPKHALLLDAVLVAAVDLVNGTTIRQAAAVERVEYIHFELDAHEAVFAEGAAAETFLDEGHRSAFSHCHGSPVLPGRDDGYCAPRVTQGYALEVIRRRLEARSLRMRAA